MGAFLAGLGKKILADHAIGSGKSGGTGPSPSKAMETLKSIKSADPDSFKRGGVVKRTGMALVHKGERVLTKRQQKRYSGKSRSK